jgi:hypothetical protein
MRSKDEDFLRSVMEQRRRFRATDPQIPSYTYRGQDRKIPSLCSGIGNATLAPAKVYTGTEMIGIGQLHKSNAVPVFRQDDAIDLANMRR